MTLPYTQIPISFVLPKRACAVTGLFLGTLNLEYTRTSLVASDRRTFTYFFKFFFFSSFDYYLTIIYIWLHWGFVAMQRLSLVAASGGYSLLPCVGFSLLLVAEHGL